MVDEIKGNLEPIEEGDLNLKDKFLGGVEKDGARKASGFINDTEAPAFPDKATERKEGNAEKDSTYSKILSKVTSPTSAVQNDVSTDADAASKEIDYESRVNKLVELAETKGIVHAVKVARHLEDNYLLDELHDKLLGDDLHAALIKKGFISED